MATTVSGFQYLPSTTLKKVPFITLTSYRCLRLFFYLFYEAIGTASTPGLLCQPRVIVKMIVEKLMECRLGGETEVLGENCPSATFLHHKIPHDQTRF
jgi:hypothetical protein